MSGPPAVAAPFLASAALLAAAGAAKLVRPDYTARALAVAGLPHHRHLVRAGALAEMAVAVAALAWPAPVTGALVGTAYLAFGVFVLVALRRGWPLSSCGCFGRPDSKPGYQHAALNFAAAGAAAWWAAGSPPGLIAMFDHSPWRGAPLLLLGVVIAGLAYSIWDSPLSKADP